MHSTPLAQGTDSLAALERGVGAKVRDFLAGGGISTGLETLVVTCDLGCKER